MVISLVFWVLIVIIVGIFFGVYWLFVVIEMEIFSKVFIEIIKVFILLIIFFMIVLGISYMGDLKKVG